MSNAVTALNGAASQGYVTLTEAPLTGMVTLRGDLADKGLATSLKAATGADVPGMRGMTQGQDISVAWMAPDEVLILCAYDQAVGITAALNGAKTLAVVVSDARAVFDLAGDRADEVLAKAAPVDIQRLGPNEMRRTRLAQVPIAVWRSKDGLRLICFRSVAGYVFDVLSTLSRHGSEV